MALIEGGTDAFRAVQWWPPSDVTYKVSPAAANQWLRSANAA